MSFLPLLVYPQMLIPSFSSLSYFFNSVESRIRELILTMPSDNVILIVSHSKTVFKNCFCRSSLTKKSTQEDNVVWDLLLLLPGSVQRKDRLIPMLALRWGWGVGKLWPTTKIGRSRGQNWQMPAREVRRSFPDAIGAAIPPPFGTRRCTCSTPHRSGWSSVRPSVVVLWSSF